MVDVRPLFPLYWTFLCWWQFSLLKKPQSLGSGFGGPSGSQAQVPHAPNLVLTSNVSSSLRRNEIPNERQSSGSPPPLEFSRALVLWDSLGNHRVSASDYLINYNFMQSILTYTSLSIQYPEHSNGNHTAVHNTPYIQVCPLTLQYLEFLISSRTAWQGWRRIPNDWWVLRPGSCISCIPFADSPIPSTVWCKWRTSTGCPESSSKPGLSVVIPIVPCFNADYLDKNDLAPLTRQDFENFRDVVKDGVQEVVKEAVQQGFDRMRPSRNTHDNNGEDKGSIADSENDSEPPVIKRKPKLLTKHCPGGRAYLQVYFHFLKSMLFKADFSLDPGTNTRTWSSSHGTRIGRFILQSSGCSCWCGWLRS
jgi:hypothetical protein